MGVQTEKMKMKEKKQSEGIFDDIFALNLHIKYLNKCSGIYRIHKMKCRHQMR